MRDAEEAAEIVIVLDGMLARSAIPALVARLRIMLEAEPHRTVICDVQRLTRPDAVTVEALARLQLTARHSGRALRVRHAPAELVDLLAFLGLNDIVLLEPRRQSEEREQPGGVEEETDPTDPSAG